MRTFLGKAARTSWTLNKAYRTQSEASIGTQTSAPTGVEFNATGTKFFVIDGSVPDKIFAYSMSTPWDLSTASYDSVSLSIGAQDNLGTDLTFNSDGTKLFVLGNQNDSVYSYTLTSGYNLATASYDSVSFSVTTQSPGPQDIAFKENGAKMYVIGRDALNVARVFQYSLTPWDIGTAVYDSISLDVSAQQSLPRDIAFKPDGTKMFLIGSGLASPERIHQYTLSNPWDISTAVYDSVFLTVTNPTSDAYGINFKPDGAFCFVLGLDTRRIYTYAL